MAYALRVRTIIAAYEQTVRSSLELASTLGERDWDLPTECPGWTVKDQFSHLAGVEMALLGDPVPDVEVPEFEHVRNDFGQFMEVAVHARRPLSGPDVAAQLAGALERRLAELPGLDPERVVRCPDGRDGSYTRFMTFRAMDCWTHEQDVRRAVGRPGNLDAPAARCFWELTSPGLPRVVAKKAGAEPGRSVAFRISGPPDFHVAVRVDDDHRGRLAEPEKATAELSMDWETYVRLTAGRCTPEAVTVRVDGDRELASRVLAGMAMTP